MHLFHLICSTGLLHQNPVGQINMRDARVEEVEHMSDSDSEEKDAECPHERTIGIFPTHQGPTYLLMPHKQDKDNWLYHLTVVSGGGPSAGTQYEQLVQRLMETDGDSSCVLWRHPLLLHTKESITSPLTSLTSETLQTEAIKLFKVDTIFHRFFPRCVHLQFAINFLTLYSKLLKLSVLIIFKVLYKIVLSFLSIFSFSLLKREYIYLFLKTGLSKT